jgi:hypothetical protein
MGEKRTERQSCESGKKEVSGPEADHGFWIQTTEREQELRKCREDEKREKNLGCLESPKL